MEESGKLEAVTHTYISDPLKLLQDDISTNLQKILRHDEEHGHNEDSKDEETFIRVNSDVIKVALIDIK